MNTAPQPGLPWDGQRSAHPIGPPTPVGPASVRPLSAPPMSDHPTTRLPASPVPAAGRPAAGAPRTDRAAASAGADSPGHTPGTDRVVRILESIGGLFGAGVLTLGLVLLVLQLVAPAVVTGATGPTWGAVAAHLAVGAAAEGIRLARHRFPVPVRITAAVLTIAAVVAVLFFCWWF